MFYYYLFLVKSLWEKARVIGTTLDTPEMRARLYKRLRL